MERHWARRAGRFALRVNLGWWLQSLIPLSIAIGCLGSVALLIARRSGWSLRPIGLVTLALVLVAAVVAWFLARPRFFTKNDAYARLDLSLGLFNGLTSAAEGVGRWPAPGASTDPLRWRPTAFWPLLVPLVMLGVALSIPIAPTETAEARPQAEPIAWSEIEETIDRLAEDPSVVDQRALEDWQARLDELRKQPEENWFEHPSLEAGDHLRDQLDGAMSKLEQDLMGADRALSEMENASKPSAELDDRWKQALQDLERGKLALDPELAKRLKEIDLEHARALTPEELAKLKKAIDEGLKQVRLAEGKPTDDATLIGLVPRAGEGEVDRGRADAPLSLGERTDAERGRAENIASHELERASIGDVVGLSGREHEIDPSLYPGRRNGGEVGQRGGGGETVWKSSLPPSEQDFLERWFK